MLFSGIIRPLTQGADVGFVVPTAEHGAAGDQDVGTGGGGSTRIPAAANGMVGLKQSNGVIPHSQVADAFGNYTYVTPMTRTVMDTALMLQAMAGPHPSDPWSIGVAPQDYIAAARPDSAEVAASLGYALHRLGEEVGAGRQIRRSLRLDPDLHEARIYLGHLLYDRGDWEGALREFERVDRKSVV